MRKYVKPMMESEAFVANEYVSYCTSMICTECGNGENYPGLKKNDVINNNKLTEVVPFSEVYKYYNDLGGVSPEKCHSEVEIIEGKKPAWIDRISDWSEDLMWLENLLWGWYKDYFGDGNQSITKYYHPVQLTYSEGSGPNAS